MDDNVGIKQDFISERERMALDRALSESPPTPGSALELAMRFHEAYERLAPRFGYETKTETREFDPQAPNGRLMIAVCREIIEQNADLERTARSDGTLQDFVGCDNQSPCEMQSRTNRIAEGQGETAEGRTGSATLPTGVITANFVVNSEDESEG